MPEWLTFEHFTVPIQYESRLLVLVVYKEDLTNSMIWQSVDIYKRSNGMLSSFLDVSPSGYSVALSRNIFGAGLGGLLEEIGDPRPRLTYCRRYYPYKDIFHAQLAQMSSIK